MADIRSGVETRIRVATDGDLPQLVAIYNYFVNSHPMGISGLSTPRGSIHTNKQLSFYFANGLFVDAVTAVEGFDYFAGATPENTTLLGPADPNAQEVGELTKTLKGDALLLKRISLRVGHAVHHDCGGAKFNLLPGSW